MSANNKNIATDVIGFDEIDGFLIINVGPVTVTRKSPDQHLDVCFPGLSPIAGFHVACYVAHLRANAKAWADWERRPPGYRKRVTHWIMSAKREETRQRRLQRLIDDPELG